ncbi:AAA family ATPase [Acetobacter cerevisiae]|uniref:AAA family ATPase n=1 Tax=Acetobacter cerevisiae TaxID=178900 RepID=A0ABT1EW38_9PROT|nr:AAA family ATPase [Acetobacter cerevisiae]MCP1246680.1 AAA family ATPase [Acetobacter cerevisiae]MCP1256219.1 AAA family ATPase [Acetobacter cerevisiae]
MRFPNSRDLNEEQEDIYLYAPHDGRMLVTGPPGTGKTVLAVLRALEVAKSRKTPVVAMFNRVLESYTSSRIPESARKHWENIRFTTVHRLFAQIWNGLAVPPSLGDDWIYLATSYAEKDDAKSCGAVWDPESWYPGRRRKGCWKVDSARFFSVPELFNRWNPRAQMPISEGQASDIDWHCYAKALFAHAQNLSWASLDFDILIIDEAQDFPPEFFDLIYVISLGVLGNARKPSLMILADENQRITERNSTIEEIRAKLHISDDRHYRLTNNFRNTLQIAQVARHFYAGMATGIPALPERTGILPELRRCPDIASASGRILRYAENNPLHEIGVICLGRDANRASYFRELSRTAPASLPVQTYSSVEAEYRTAKELSFDTPGISIFNSSSCKGLEFDAVFIVGLQEEAARDEMRDFLRMKLYVMTSRGRDCLFLVWIGCKGDRSAVLDLMPQAPLVRIYE